MDGFKCIFGCILATDNLLREADVERRKIEVFLDVKLKDLDAVLVANLLAEIIPYLTKSGS